jgi:hypothetical protein
MPKPVINKADFSRGNWLSSQLIEGDFDFAIFLCGLQNERRRDAILALLRR